MDYENYAVPALNLARARIAASGGCMGCPTCGVGSGMFMGGKGSNIAKKVFELKAANPSMTLEEAAAYIAANTKPRKPRGPRPVKFGPARATKAQLRAIAKAERDACISSCRTAYRGALPVGAAPSAKSAAARDRFAAQSRQARSMMKQYGLTQKEAWKALRGPVEASGIMRRRRTRGRGLETGDGLDYGSGMQYY